MKTRFFTLLFGTILCSIFCGNLSAQTGNDNLTGPAGIFNGNITTAGEYDPYTANCVRRILDISVAGAAGTQPLALVRTYNSRSPNGGGFSWGWRHNYEWSVNDAPARSLSSNFNPTSYAVSFPDGRTETFAAPADGAGAWHAATGVVERFLPLNLSTMKAYLLLNDGSKVEFTATRSNYVDQCTPDDFSGKCTWYQYSYVASAIIDPYGLTTTLTYNANGLRVTEPAGRWLQFYNTTISFVSLIDHVTASDGRTVQYHYLSTPVAGAATGYTRLDSVTYFGDSTLVARYTYQKPNAGSGADGVPLLSTCIDPMYAGPMWKIGYVYATANADSTLVVYGQLKSENYFNGTAIGGAVSTLAVNNLAHTRVETRGDGPTRTFTYTNNLLTKCTDFKGVAASQTYDANNFVSSAADRNNHTATYTHNAITGKVTQVKFPATPGDAPAGQGTISRLYSSSSCFDANNKDGNNPYYVCQDTDEAGHLTRYSVVGGTGINKMRVGAITYQDGSFETFAYDLYGHVTSHRLTTGGTETFAYYYTANGDPAYKNGLVKEYRDPYHATGNPSARYDYDSLSRLIVVTDALGGILNDLDYTTSYAYNPRGQLKTTTLPSDPKGSGNRHTIVNAYNPDGTLASVTDQLNQVTSYTYDDYKRILTVKTPVRGYGDSSVNVTTFTYTRYGTASPYLHTVSFPFSIASPSGRGRNIDCDGNFRKTIDRQAPGTVEEATTSYGYDNAGNLTTVRAPAQQPTGPVTATAYDERNRPMSITDVLNHATTFRYDAANRKASVTRPNGQVVTYNTYDAMNRLTQQTATQAPEPNAITKYSYDPSGGKLLTMTDPNNNTYTYGYDWLNRKTSLTYPGGSTETWSYENTGGGARAGNGLLYQFKNRAGNVETFTYDNLNRLTLANWNDAVTPDVTTAYDAANRVTQITNSNSTIDRLYFNDGLLHVETNKYADGIARQVNYNYDPDGRRSTVYYPGYTADSTYTQRGQLDTLSVNSSQVANYGYDAAGNMTGRSLNNSTSSTWVYDVLNRCTSISHALVGTTRTFGYGYDSVGNRNWVKRDGGNGDVYDYDLNDQAITTKLNIANPDTTAPGPQTIVYDANGNRTSFAPPYVAPETYDPVNALNQYTKRNGSSAGYDANGNMTTGFDGSTYTYDAQNRLLTARKGTTIDTFTYDGLNRQISKKIGSQPLYYRVYDGWDLLGEYKTGTSSAIFAYLYGAGGIVKNVVTNNYYYQDASGSTSHVANSAGALKEYYRYDLHGQPIFYNAAGNQLSDTAIGVRHLFTGQQWYNELGLYDLRNRYYSPDIGRFLQADPISFDGDPINLYRYCGNNPTTLGDPRGLGPWTIPVVQNNGNNPPSVPRVVVTPGGSFWGTPTFNPSTPSETGWLAYSPGSPLTGVTYSPGNNPFSGIGSNPFGPSPFTIQTGVPQAAGLASVPAVNPTVPFSFSPPSPLSPNTPIPLTDEALFSELNSLYDYVSNKQVASMNLIKYVQFMRTLNTSFYSQQMYTYNGILTPLRGISSGHEINYIGVGMGFAAYGLDPFAMHFDVIMWKDHFFPGGMQGSELMWSDLGYQYYLNGGHL